MTDNFADCAKFCVDELSSRREALFALAAQFYRKHRQLPSEVLRDKLLREKIRSDVWLQVLKHIAESADFGAGAKWPHADLRAWLDGQMRPFKASSLVVPKEHQVECNRVLGLALGDSKLFESVPVRTAIDQRGTYLRLCAALLGHEKCEKFDGVVEARIKSIEAAYERQVRLVEALKSVFPTFKGPWQLPIPTEFRDDALGAWCDSHSQGAKQFPLTFAASAVPDAGLALALAKLFVAQGALRAEDFVPSLLPGVVKAVQLLEGQQLLLRDVAEFVERNHSGVKDYLVQHHVAPDTLLWAVKVLSPSLDDTIEDIAQNTWVSDFLLVALKTLTDKKLGLRKFISDVYPHLTAAVQQKLSHNFLQFLAKWLGDKEAQRRVGAVNATQVMFLPEQARQHAAFGVHSTVVDHFCYLYDFVAPIRNLANLTEIVRNAKVLPEGKDLRLSLESAMRNQRVLDDLLNAGGVDRGEEVKLRVAKLMRNDTYIDLQETFSSTGHAPVDTILRIGLKAKIHGSDDMRLEQLETLASCAKMFSDDKLREFEGRFRAVKRLATHACRIATKHSNWIDGAVGKFITFRKGLMRLQLSFGDTTASETDYALGDLLSKEAEWTRELYVLRDRFKQSCVFSDAELLYIRSVLTKSGTYDVEDQKTIAKLMSLKFGRDFSELVEEALKRRARDAAMVVESLTAMVGRQPAPQPTQLAQQIVIVVAVSTSLVFDYVCHFQCTEANNKADVVEQCLFEGTLVTSIDADYPASAFRLVERASGVGVQCPEQVFHIIVRCGFDVDTFASIHGCASRSALRHKIVFYMVDCTNRERIVVSSRRGIAVSELEAAPKLPVIHHLASTRIVCGKPRSGKTSTIRELSSKKEHKILFSPTTTIGELCNETAKLATNTLRQHYHIELGSDVSKFSTLLLLFRLLVLRGVSSGFGRCAILPKGVSVFVECSEQNVRDATFLSVFERTAAKVPPYVATAMALAAEAGEELLFEDEPLKCEVLERFHSQMITRCPLLRTDCRFIPVLVKTAFYLCTPNAEIQLSSHKPDRAKCMPPDFFLCIRRDNTPVVIVFEETKRKIAHLQHSWSPKELVCIESLKPDELLDLLLDIINGDPVVAQRKNLAATAQVFHSLLRLSLCVDCRCAPAVLVGETGCGKTFSINILAELKGLKAFSLEVNAGTTPQDIAEFAKNKNADSIVFFDEINTALCHDHFKSVIVDKKAVVRGNPLLLEKAHIFAACNPYRTVDRKVSRNGPNTKKLVYCVQPCISPTVESYASKFQVHSEAEERDIVFGMAKSRGLPDTAASRLAELVPIGVRLLKKYAPEIPVSFRTTSRVVRLTLELKQLFAKKVNLVDDENPSDDQIIELAVAVVFYVPLRARLFVQIEGEQVREDNPRGEFRDTLPDCVTRLERAMDIFADQLDLHEYVSNVNLKESLLVVFLGIVSRTPLLLVGPPGSSKSLALFVLLNSWVSRKGVFAAMPMPFPFLLQCTSSTSGSQIDDIFQRAQNFERRHRAKNAQFISIVFVDEIALADESPSRPLKVLNKWLDHEGDLDYPAVVSTSNFDIDWSLVNRCLVISRDAPSIESLADLLAHVYPSSEPKRSGIVKNIHVALNDISSAASETRHKVEQGTGMRHVYAFVNDLNKLSDTDADSDAIINRLLWKNFGTIAERLSVAGEKVSLWELTKARLATKPYCTFESKRRALYLSCDSFSTFRALQATLFPDRPVQYIFGCMVSDDDEMRSTLISRITQALQREGLLVLVRCDLVFQHLLDVFNGHFVDSNGTSMARVSIDGNSFHYVVHQKCEIVVLSLPMEQSKLLQMTYAVALHDRLEHGTASKDDVDEGLTIDSIDFDDALGCDQVTAATVKSILTAPEVIVGMHRSFLHTIPREKRPQTVLRLVNMQKFWSTSHTLEAASRLAAFEAVAIHLDAAKCVKDSARTVLVTFIPRVALDPSELESFPDSILSSSVLQSLALPPNSSVLRINHDTPDNFVWSQLTYKCREDAKIPLVVFASLSDTTLSNVGSYHTYALCEAITVLAEVPSKKVVLVLLLPSDTENVSIDPHPLFDHVAWPGPSKSKKEIQELVECQFQAHLAKIKTPLGGSLQDAVKCAYITQPTASLHFLSDKIRQWSKSIREEFLCDVIRKHEKHVLPAAFTAATFLYERYLQFLLVQVIHSRNLAVCFDVRRWKSELDDAVSRMQTAKEEVALQLLPPPEGRTPFGNMELVSTWDSQDVSLTNKEIDVCGLLNRSFVARFTIAEADTALHFQTVYEGVSTLFLRWCIDNDESFYRQISDLGWDSISLRTNRRQEDRSTACARFLHGTMFEKRVCEKYQFKTHEVIPAGFDLPTAEFAAALKYLRITGRDTIVRDEALVAVLQRDCLKPLDDDHLLATLCLLATNPQRMLLILNDGITPQTAQFSYYLALISGNTDLISASKKFLPSKVKPKTDDVADTLDCAGCWEALVTDDYYSTCVRLAAGERLLKEYIENAFCPNFAGKILLCMLPRNVEEALREGLQEEFDPSKPFDWALGRWVVKANTIIDQYNQCLREIKFFEPQPEVDLDIISIFETMLSPTRSYTILAVLKAFPDSPLRTSLLAFLTYSVSFVAHTQLNPQTFGDASTFPDLQLDIPVSTVVTKASVLHDFCSTSLTEQNVRDIRKSREVQRVLREKSSIFVAHVIENRSTIAQHTLATPLSEDVPKNIADVLKTISMSCLLNVFRLLKT